MARESLRERISKKIKTNKFFTNMFGFESGIDITNDNQVLYRKNVVIKNIILVINLLYTLIFTIVSIGEPSNWLLTALLFPVTFGVNYFLKKMINKGPDDKTTQTIAMYVSAFYLFLSSIIMYIKLQTGEQAYLETCGYILLYQSLAVCSYYQDKKMLKNIFIWVFIGVTILHFTVTYPIVSSSEAKNINEFFANFFTSSSFRDILLRTALLLIYMLILYVVVSMSNYMQEERKKELQKRREVQENFTNVVTEIFDVTLAKPTISEDEIRDVEVLSKMTKKLASLLGKSPAVCDEIESFSKIHIEKQVNFKATDYTTEDEKFEALREQTELGSKLISRLQLERKAEDIIRATFEGSDDDTFISRERSIQNSEDAQIILICELYISMRGVKNYKKAYKHSLTMEYMENHFKLYFDAVIFDRFVKFANDFEELYNES